jgi:hypothetical protein
MVFDPLDRRPGGAPVPSRARILAYRTASLEPLSTNRLIPVGRNAHVRLAAVQPMLAQPADLEPPLRPTLLRRRSVWVPTVWGCLALAVLLAALLLAAGRALYPFLAPDAPVGHGILVVEGWGDDAVFAEAVRLWESGAYERVVTTGGPIDEASWRGRRGTWAEAAAAHLRALGVPGGRVLAAPSPESAQDRTFLAAVEVRERLAHDGIGVDALDVLTHGPHARRSWRLYGLAFGDAVRVGVHPAPAREYDADRWWRSSRGARDVVGEAIAWAWTACCFRAPPPGSRDERWGRPEDLPARLRR